MHSSSTAVSLSPKRLVSQSDPKSQVPLKITHAVLVVRRKLLGLFNVHNSSLSRLRSEFTALEEG